MNLHTSRITSHLSPRWSGVNSYPPAKRVGGPNPYGLNPPRFPASSRLPVPHVAPLGLCSLGDVVVL